jgi:anaerobic selenocysteine-containing dehydrogenase
VRTVAGVPVKIEGNPLHPVNRGALCPRGAAALESLYDPDRLISPLRRVGPKGTDEWEALSWDEALVALSGPLAELRSRGRPQALALIGGEYRGLTDRLWDRFARAYGSPNYVRLRNLSPEVPEDVAVLMHGEKNPISYDLRETSFVLSFGCNWLEGWRSPVFQMQAYGHMRQGRREGRAEVAHVEPRLSYSAAKADLWIPVKPGTEGILALGLAHLILREQLYDDDFVSNHTFGFEDWVDSDGKEHKGYKRLVLEEYTPVRVSEMTGTRPETIVTLARRFAGSRPAIALGDNRSALEGHDLFTRMAIHSLNVLVGSIGVSGGVLPGRKPPPLTVWPELELDEIAAAGLKSPRLDGAGKGERFLDTDAPGGLVEAVLEGESSPVEILILHRANPLYGRAGKENFREALEKIPLVVSLSGVPDEVSRYADLILPEHHFLESWQDDLVAHLPGFTLFGIGQPVTKPLYDTRNPCDLILNLAEGVGGSVAASFPWESYEGLLEDSARGLFEDNRGYVISTPADELLREVLQREGYRVPEFEAFDGFWESLVAKGAWWDPAVPIESARHRFYTPSRKFEFYSQALETRLNEVVASGERLAQEERERMLSSLGVKTNEDGIFFPRALLSRGNQANEGFPFALKTYELLTIGDGASSNLPSLQENLATHVQGCWESWVEIHPEVAEEFNLRDGDWIWVESKRNRVRVRARLFAGTRRDVVAMPVGQGHQAGGRWSQQRGVDASDLAESATAPHRGFGIRETIRVRIVRA